MFQSRSQTRPFIPKDTQKGKQYTIRLFLLTCIILISHIAAGVLEILKQKNWKNYLFLGFHLALGTKQIIVYYVNRRLRKQKQKPTRFTFIMIILGMILAISHIVLYVKEKNRSILQYTIIGLNGSLLLFKILQMILLCKLRNQ